MTHFFSKNSSSLDCKVDDGLFLEGEMETINSKDLK